MFPSVVWLMKEFVLAETLSSFSKDNTFRTLKEINNKSFHDWTLSKER